MTYTKRTVEIISIDYPSGRTTDIEHAKNFELINNTYYERW